MDFKDLANKAKDALAQNPSLIDKAGDFVDGRTDGKFASAVDKAQDAAKKFAGAQEQKPADGEPQQ